ncbi:hypothetical protein TNCV_3887981 [Trichonephila clavipes]|nr:hypothetical protein TNCV_3887981 [Trichonephila clavipes]
MRGGGRLFDNVPLRPIIRLLSKSVSCSYCRRLRLRGIKSQYRLSKSSDSFALEKVVRDSNINIRGNIFNKSIQLSVFADGIDIIARAPIALKQAFLSFERGHLDGTESQ